MLAHVPALAAGRQVAARHQERLDGSGYPRGLTAATLTPRDRLLAAADMCHAMAEPRPYRDALTPEAIAAELTREVHDGRLDGDAVAAVLTASGQPGTRTRGGPSGLTAREVEVLALLARGHSNRQIADRLWITPKTAANHIAHIYTKIDVSSRAAATLFASRHGLVGAFESEATPDRRR
jgi:DNA-binding CsgD family transcriptional regulator